MLLSECVVQVKGEWIVPVDNDTAFDDVVVSDLMSDVLVCEKDDFILVTSLTSEQVVRTADIVDARGILITNGKRPQPAMQQLAERQGLAVITTRLSTFEACLALAGCRE